MRGRFIEQYLIQYFCLSNNRQLSKYMFKRYFIAILATSLLFSQCKKDTSEAPAVLTDTVIAGSVQVYDQYGKLLGVQPAVKVEAWLADSAGNLSTAIGSTITDSAGKYRFSGIETGLYSLKFSAEGYGQFTKNNIRFDGMAGVQVADVKLSTYAAGDVIINGITVSQLSADLGGGNSSIADIDRTVTFGGSSAEPFTLKVRYFFGLDSSVAQGNYVFSYVSGAVEGASGAQDQQSVKFGLSNLKTYFDDSTLVYVAAAVETVPSQIYSIGETTYFPNVRLPLSNVKTIYYLRNAIK